MWVRSLNPELLKEFVNRFFPPTSLFLTEQVQGVTEKKSFRFISGKFRPFKSFQNQILATIQGEMQVKIFHDIPYMEHLGLMVASEGGYLMTQRDGSSASYLLSVCLAGFEHVIIRLIFEGFL